ncbi:MAG: hypothetical protein ISS33_06040 [Candidatus Omnitrophica bacterium]|nr:hypothetical protein [Candidatus Omnitrophota bacterium]
MKRFGFFVTMFLVVFILSSGVLFSQEQERAEVYGVVESVSDSSIVVEEWLHGDAEGDTFEKITFTVSSDTEFTNVESLADIEEGQEVDVGYIVDEEGVKQAERIYVYLY